MYILQVLEYTREELRPLMQALHDLFFPDAKEFGQKIGTPAGVHNSFVGSVHTLNVSAVAFLRTLDSWCVATLNIPVPAGR